MSQDRKPGLFGRWNAIPLWQKILAGLVLGLIIGLVFCPAAGKLKPIGFKGIAEAAAVAFTTTSSSGTPPAGEPVPRRTSASRSASRASCRHTDLDRHCKACRARV